MENTELVMYDDVFFERDVFDIIDEPASSDQRSDQWKDVSWTREIQRCIIAVTMQKRLRVFSNT